MDLIIKDIFQNNQLNQCISSREIRENIFFAQNFFSLALENLTTLLNNVSRFFIHSLRYIGLNENNPKEILVNTVKFCIAIFY